MGGILAFKLSRCLKLSTLVSPGKAGTLDVTMSNVNVNSDILYGGKSNLYQSKRIVKIYPIICKICPVYLIYVKY